MRRAWHRVRRPRRSGPSAGLYRRHRAETRIVLVRRCACSRKLWDPASLVGLAHGLLGGGSAIIIDDAAVDDRLGPLGCAGGGCLCGKASRYFELSAFACHTWSIGFLELAFVPRGHGCLRFLYSRRFLSTKPASQSSNDGFRLCRLSAEARSFTATCPGDIPVLSTSLFDCRSVFNTGACTWDSINSMTVPLNSCPAASLTPRPVKLSRCRNGFNWVAR